MKYAIAYSLIVFTLSGVIELAFAVSDPVSMKKLAKYSDRLHSQLDVMNRSRSTSSKTMTVILETSDFSDTVIQQVKSFAGKFHYHSGNRHELRITANKLQQLLQHLPDSVYVRLPYPHMPVSVISQGVGIMGAADMHSLGNAGSGVKVGVIDMGFASYTNSQASGDLPVNLTITDYTGTGTGGINHGTNVAEIVHDMAPGAEIYLAKVSSSLQLEQAMNDMKAAGVKIINHSVAWFGAAFYDGTGPMCDITNTAEASGVQWFNAMGNSRNAHYLGTFTDTNGDLRHEFSEGNNSNTVSLIAGASVSLILNWDNYASADVDYNLHLYNGDPAAGASIVASSQNQQTGRRNSAPPFEAISYTAASTAVHHMVVTKAGSSVQNLPLSIFSTGPSLGIKTFASSITQPADCSSVISVAATNLTDGVESFSSEGPTTDGRLKPDISATNRTVTSLSSSFAGTSGASPHAAGAAALLLSQNAGLTLSQLRSQLISDAKDVSVSGFDSRTGYGRISLDADQDNINHDLDNCLLVANTDQKDLDIDGLGDLCDNDIDGDGLLNGEETTLGTNPMLFDTDTDGLSDGEELLTYFTDPLLPDSDTDNLSDGDEVNIYGTNPVASNQGDLSPRNSPDGILDISDLLILLRLNAGLDIANTYEEISADLNSDGLVDVRDALLLRRALGY